MQRCVRMTAKQIDNGAFDNGGRHSWNEEIHTENEQRPKVRKKEVNRLRKWIELSRRTLLLPKHLSPSENRLSMFAICIRSMTNWSMPSSLKKQMIRKPDNDVRLFLSMTFYHSTSRHFFGTTYLGREHLIKDGTIMMNELLYFRSQFDNPNCYIVLELIATIRDSSSGVVCSQYGCGWSLIRFPRIVSKHSEKNTKLQCNSVKVDLHNKTPRKLIFMGTKEVDVFFEASSKGKSHSSAINCDVFRWNSIDKKISFVDLIEDNEIIGADDVVPGVKTTTLNCSRGEEMTLGACFGSECIHGDKSAQRLKPRTHIALDLMNTLLFHDVQINFQENRLDFEEKLMSSLMKSTTYSKCNKKAGFLFGIPKKILMPISKARKTNSTGPKIVQRIMKFAVHNGHKIISNEDVSWKEIKLQVDENSSNILRSDLKVELNTYFKHPLCALVCLVEYIVHLHDFNSVANAVKVALGYQIYIPYDGKRMRLGNVKNNSNIISLPLISGKSCCKFYNELVYCPRQTKNGLDNKQTFLQFVLDYHSPKDGSLDGETTESNNETEMQSEISSITCTSNKDIVDYFIENRVGNSGKSEGGETSVGHFSKKENDEILELSTESITSSKSPLMQCAEKSNLVCKVQSPVSSPLVNEDRTSPIKDCETIIKGEKPTGNIDYPSDELNHISMYSTEFLSSAFSPKDDDCSIKDTDLRSAEDYLKNTAVTLRCVGCSFSENIFCTFNFFDQPEARIDFTAKAADPKMHVEAMEGIDPNTVLGATLKYDYKFLSMSFDGKRVQEYFKKKTLHMDVWDAETMFHLGTVAVPLKDLIPNQGPSVTIRRNYAVSPSLSLFDGTKILLANIKDTTKEIEKKYLSLEITASVCGIPAELQGPELHHDTHCDQTLSIAKIIPELQELIERVLQKDFEDMSTMGGLRWPPENQPKEKCDDLRSKQLQDLENYKKGKNICDRLPNASASREHLSLKLPQFNDRLRHREFFAMKVINWYRLKKKKSLISHHIENTAADTISIDAPFGETVFMELPIFNPFKTREQLRIIYDTKETGLKVITKSEELQFFRGRKKAIIARDTFGLIAQNGEVSLDDKGIPFITLSGKETAGVPFTLLYHDMQAFCKRQFGDQNIHVLFESSTHGIVYSLNIIVRLKSPVIDKTIHLINMGEPMLRKIIQYKDPKLDSPSNDVRAVQCICLPETDVVCNLQDRGGASETESGEVSVEYRCGISNDEFLLFLYNDKYFSKIQECWRFEVKKYCKVEIDHCIGGHKDCHKLTIEGMKENQGAIHHIFPHKANLRDAENFCAVLSASNTLVVTYRFNDPGRREVLLHMIDKPSKRIVFRWKMIFLVSKPNISREHLVEIQACHSTTLKIKFSNTWKVDRLVLVSSNEDLMVPEEPFFDTMEGQTDNIELCIKPQREIGTFHAYLFLQDFEENVKDCFLIRIHVKSNI